jgi:sugar transferase (PEP-CTERM system associated)
MFCPPRHAISATVIPDIERAMLRVFRHYLWFSSLLLALCDAGILFIILTALGWVLGAQGIDLGPDGARRAATLMTLAATLAMSSAGLYNRDRCIDLTQVVSRALVVLPLVLVGVMAVLVVRDMLSPEASRPGYYYLGAAGLTAFFPLLVGLRRTFMHALDSFDGLRHRVVVVGNGRHAVQIQRLALAGSGRSFTVVTVLDHLSPVELVDFCRRERIDEVVVPGMESRDLPLPQLLACKLSGVEITPHLTFWERETGQVDLDAVTANWLVFCDGFQTGIVRAWIKRGFDLVVATLLLVLSLPLTVAVAVLIKLESRGPIFYRQERVGQFGKTFHVLKFRSMRVDAEQNGPQWAARNDARVTRVGAVIRKVRIDEIPQAINVLKGEMSFVGPRPERPVFVDALRQTIPYYDERHMVKPGITGWAQINYPYGATAEDARNKLAYDLYYVKNTSLFLDVIIFLQTAKVLLWNEGAR